MGRGKLALEFITNDRSRRTTFDRRKKGLMKKAEEFSILCGVDTCMIIYSPDGPSRREPTLWPHDPDKARRVINRYLNEGVDHRKRYAVGLPEFVSRRRKLDSEVAKVQSANWDAKCPVSDDLINGLSQDQLRTLLAMVGMKLESAKKRLAAVQGVDPTMHVEEIKFNNSLIHSNINGNRQFVPMNMDNATKAHVEFPPPVISSYLSPLMDLSSDVNNPMMGLLVGDSSANSNAANHHQNTNSYYCSYPVTIPTDYDLSFSQHRSLLTHRSPTGPSYQYDPMLGILSAPENALFDYTRWSMLGLAHSMAMTARQNLQQQPLVLQYPRVQQGSTSTSLFGLYGEEAPFHYIDGNNGHKDCFPRLEGITN